MKIEILLFGPLAEAAGSDRVTLETDSAPRVRELIELLAHRTPRLAPRLSTATVALNREYAGADTWVSDGDEVALIPPVSGG